MKINARDAVNVNVGPFAENISQEDSMSSAVKVALGILVPAVILPIGIWGAQALIKYKRNYDKKKEDEKIIRDYMTRRTEEPNYPIYKVTFCVTAVIILLCKSWEIRDWMNGEGQWANVTPFNSSNISKAVSEIDSMTPKKVTKALVKILNLSQCYFNEAPIINSSLLWSNNQNLSPTNHSLTEIFSGTINGTKNQTAISFDLSEFAKSVSQWYQNFSFGDMVSAQMPSIDFASYFNFKTVTTTLTTYTYSISMWARNYICEIFAIKNC